MKIKHLTIIIIILIDLMSLLFPPEHNADFNIWAFTCILVWIISFVGVLSFVVFYWDESLHDIKRRFNEELKQKDNE